MLNVTHYQRNANQNHNEVLSKSLQAINAGEGLEKREPSYTEYIFKSFLKVPIYDMFLYGTLLFHLYILLIDR